jgi:hypothetical protein
MVFFIVGVPSRFAEWCVNLTGRIVEQALGSVQVVGADSVDGVGEAVIKTTAPHLVFGSYYPVGRLRAALSEGTARFVVALEDPRRAVGDMVARHGSDFLFEATRMIARSSAALNGWDTVPGSLVLHGETCRAAPLTAAAAIARHLGIAASDADLASAVAVIAAAGGDLAGDDGAWWAQLDDAAREAVSGAVAPYAAHFSGGQLGPIVWQRELFYINEEPVTAPYTVPATRPMDITGRARILIYGPGLFLPTGGWTAAISLGLSREAAEMSYMVEVFNGMQLAQTKIVPQGGERFVEVVLNFSVDDSFEPQKLIQIRIWNERAAFDGRIAIGHIKLTRQSDVPTEMKAYFETVLGS